MTVGKNESWDVEMRGSILVGEVVTQWIVNLAGLYREGCASVRPSGQPGAVAVAWGHSHNFTQRSPGGLWWRLASNSILFFSPSPLLQFLCRNICCTYFTAENETVGSRAPCSVPCVHRSCKPHHERQARNMYKILIENSTKRDHPEDLGVYGSIILK
jgi:hypothetical protein